MARFFENWDVGMIKNIIEKSTTYPSIHERMSIWGDIQKKALTVNDVPDLIEKFIPPVMEHYYQQKFYGSAEFNEISSIPRSFSVVHAYLEYASIGGTSKIGVRIQTNIPVYAFYTEATEESGIHIINENIIFLQANDWPFVAVESLWSILNGRMTATMRELSSEEKRIFDEDINSYSEKHLGMPFLALKELQDNGLLSETMFDKFATKAAQGQTMTDEEGLSLPQEFFYDETLETIYGCKT